MTPYERRHHQVINGSRRKRIARGAGVAVSEVNQVIKQYLAMRKMMEQFRRVGFKGMRRMLGNLGR